MPLPKPNSAEPADEFINRCMKDEIMVEEYPDTEQRAAVCHAQLADKALSQPNQFATFCFSVESGPVSREDGTILDVSILTEGEAKGHGMMISQKTLESSITLLLGKSIPAYLSHAGASGDRLLTEAGYFSGFYRDKNKIRARKFTALESFKKYEPEKYDRLFEIAEVAPHTFGVSIVFEGQLFWEMSDGSERPLEDGWDAPENSRFSIPTVRPLQITSADFVDTPAANGALFSGKVDNQTEGKDMNELEQIELDNPANESASAKHVSDEEKIPPSVPAPEPTSESPAPKKKPKKKALAEGDYKDEELEEEEKEELEEEEKEELEEPDNEYQEKMRAAVEEVYTHMENAVNRLREVMDMTGVPDREAAKEKDQEMSEVAELKARVQELAKLHKGTDPIKEKSETEQFASVKDAKKALIEKYLESNPTHDRSTAVLAIAKTNPELFQNN